MRSLVLAAALAAASARSDTVSNHRELAFAPPRSPSSSRSPEGFDACSAQVQGLVADLKCRVPAVRKLPPRHRAELAEYALQLAARAEGVPFAELNALVSLAAKDEDKRRLVAYFTGLACHGLPGDPVPSRRNWRTYLTECPNLAPSGAPWVTDPKLAVRRFHPGADSCWRLPAPRPADCPAPKPIWECIGGAWLDEQPKEIVSILKSHPPAQQCCYARSGVRIASGPGAGTPDTVFSERIVEDAVVEMDEMVEDTPPAHQRKIDALLARLKGGKAALHHNALDARIIGACFADWPGEKNGHVETYHRLGWGPWR